MDEKITIRKGSHYDAKDFADLIILSAPSFLPTLYGNKVKIILVNLFVKGNNLFGFHHTYFANTGHKKAGIILGYDWQLKKQEDLQTGLLLLKNMGVDFFKRLYSFLNAKKIVGWVCEREYYISNVAVFPKYRGMGLGTYLIDLAEKEAKQCGANRLSLDVETENINAINLYKKLGFTIAKKSSTKLYRQFFKFYRMYKELK